MITEGSLQVLAKFADKIGVVGFWYANAFELLCILAIFAIFAIFAVIGLIAVLTLVFKKRKRDSKKVRI